MVLLLLVISAASAVLLHLWLTGYTAEVAGRGASSGALESVVKVEGVTVEGSTLVAFVRNLGDRKVWVDKVFIEKGGVVLYALDVEGGALEIEPGCAVKVRAAVPSDLEAGRYTVRVGVSSGASMPFQFYYGGAGGGGGQQGLVFEDTFDGGPEEGWQYEHRFCSGWKFSNGYAESTANAVGAKAIIYRTITLSSSGRVEFDWLCSGSGTQFYFYVDEELKKVCPKDGRWHHVSVPLAPGTHTIKWYHEVGGMMAYNERAYLDNVRIYLEP